MFHGEGAIPMVITEHISREVVLTTGQFERLMTLIVEAIYAVRQQIGACIPIKNDVEKTG